MYAVAQTGTWTNAQILRTQRSQVMPLRSGQDRCESSPAGEAASVPARAAPAASIALVLGFGNVLLSDDGAGVKVLERLRSELGEHAADFIDAGTLSFSLLHYIEAADSLLVIDAADLNAAAGSIGLFEDVAMDGFLSSTRRRSVHEIGLIDLLDMARLQGCLPARRALLCIQPCRIDWSQTLSEPVAQAMPEAARQAQALLQRWASL
jgi:hydrogenase maturation protease